MVGGRQENTKSLKTARRARIGEFPMNRRGGPWPDNPLNRSDVPRRRSQDRITIVPQHHPPTASMKSSIIYTAGNPLKQCEFFKWWVFQAERSFLFDEETRRWKKCVGERENTSENINRVYRSIEYVSDYVSPIAEMRAQWYIRAEYAAGHSHVKMFTVRPDFAPSDCRYSSTGSASSPSFFASFWFSIPKVFGIENM